MKTAEQSARIQDYLVSVEREAAGLPAERRQELIADLAEHIAVALAERPGTETEVLRELGDPRAIAATALAEAGVAAPAKGGVHPVAPVLLLALASPAALVWSFLQLGCWIVGLVLLWMSARWTAAHKTVGTLLGVVGPVVVSLAMATVDPAGELPQMLFALGVIALGVAGGVYLWFTRKR
ncbi:HAAS signaling domain-containing protein [Streptomyces sp. NPDC050145]|uniref:HAAS signaling domain-containing protein n=1 Tax=Streptomyces sp. NPDC050145 TaxID=3365602 RepID=UPI00378EEFF2